MYLMSTEGGLRGGPSCPDLRLQTGGQGNPSPDRPIAPTKRARRVNANLYPCAPPLPTPLLDLWPGPSSMGRCALLTACPPPFHLLPFKFSAEEHTFVRRRSNTAMTSYKYCLFVLVFLKWIPECLCQSVRFKKIKITIGNERACCVLIGLQVDGVQHIHRSSVGLWVERQRRRHVGEANTGLVTNKSMGWR